PIMQFVAIVEVKKRAYQFNEDKKADPLKRKSLKRKASQGSEISVSPVPNVAKDVEVSSIQNEQPIENPSAQDERKTQVEEHQVDESESAISATSFDRTTAKLAKAKAKLRKELGEFCRGAKAHAT
ncbi:unnamed protein product, partial [Citrullus colocynthis]